MEWYKNIFIKSVKARKPGKEENFLLLLDNAPCHPPADELNDVDPQFTVQYLPPNVTSVVQPMDQGVIECMKKNYKKIFLRIFSPRYMKKMSMNSTLIQRWKRLKNREFYHHWRV